MNKRLKTAYVLARFPSLTATFIMNEIDWIHRHDIQVYIFSLFEPMPEPVHKKAQLLMPCVRYNPTFSWTVLKAQFHFLHRNPQRYLHALVQAIRYSFREPKLLLRTLAIFPKSVLFAKQAEEIGIDHIHAHFLLLGSISASVIARLLNVPFTVHPHAVGLFTRNRQSIRLQLERASRIVTISNYHRDYIAELCPNINRSNIEVIHCGIDTDHFSRSAHREHFEPIRILSVGRLVEKKGHKYLIDACARLVERGLALQCNIVGAGPDQETLRAYIGRLNLQQVVLLLGPMEQNQIVELCQTSDIYALACVIARDGDRDGVPVSLMEAMACELPVVTTPVAGILDLVRNNETGLIVAERDSVGLAAALQELIENGPLRERLGKQARKKVVEDFDIGLNTAKLALVFWHVVTADRHKLSTSSRNVLPA